MFSKSSWDQNDYHLYHTYLLSLQDEKYRNFHAKLLPGISKPIIGVRLPLLRKIAKSILKDSPQQFLAKAPEDYYEDIMIQGLVTAGLKGDLPSVLPYIRDFIPKIDNWAVCDSFVTSLKIVKKHKEDFYTFLNEYLHSHKEYHIRFGVVSLMSYYLEDEYIDDVLKKMDTITHEGYYVKMAVAWCISVAYVKYREKTLAYLNTCSLSDWTYNKALQKIMESNRVTPEEKIMIKSLKRK